MVFAMPAKTPSLGSWFLGALCVIAGPVTLATAHPHMWVDLESRVVVSKSDGNISIQQVWLFDDFFSTAVIEDAALDLDGKNVGIQKEIDRIIDALEPYSYFTTINFGGKNLSSNLVGDVTWEVVQNRIKMRFTIAVNERNGVEAQSWS